MWEIVKINSVDSKLLENAFKCGWEPFAVSTMNGAFDTDFVWLRRRKFNNTLDDR